MRVSIFFPCCNHLSDEVDYIQHHQWKVGKVMVFGGAEFKESDVVECSKYGKTYDVPYISATYSTQESVERNVLEPLEDGNNGNISFSRVIVLGENSRWGLVYLIQQGKVRRIVQIKELVVL